MSSDIMYQLRYLFVEYWPWNVLFFVICIVALALLLGYTSVKRGEQGL